MSIDELVKVLKLQPGEELQIGRSSDAVGAHYYVRARKQANGEMRSSAKSIASIELDFLDGPIIERLVNTVFQGVRCLPKEN